MINSGLSSSLAIFVEPLIQSMKLELRYRLICFIFDCIQKLILITANQRTTLKINQ